MNKQETVLIFGRSPFIYAIHQRIPELIQRYPYSIGCNTFFKSFPDVPYSAFLDKEQIGNFRGYKGKIFTTRHYQDIIPKVSFNYETFYLLKYEEFIKSKRRDQSFFWKDTPSFIIGIAINRGFKNVVLLGIDYDENNFTHFNDNEGMNATEETFKSSRKFIAEELTKHINIYKVNPDNKIDIPYISVEELINKVY